jgi:hypothetical protein
MDSYYSKDVDKWDRYNSWSGNAALKNFKGQEGQFKGGFQLLDRCDKEI